MPKSNSHKQVTKFNSAKKIIPTLPTEGVSTTNENIPSSLAGNYSNSLNHDVVPLWPHRLYWDAVQLQSSVNQATITTVQGMKLLRVCE